MKKFSLILIAAFVLTACAKSPTETKEQPLTVKTEMSENEQFKLYPTENMWTFLKLDTQNGKIWQVQYSVKGDDYRFSTALNPTPLTDDKTMADRFELFPTKNMFNFILLDKASGRTWQVQWSTETENRAIIPIPEA